MEHCRGPVSDDEDFDVIGTLPAKNVIAVPRVVIS
jgi:hypothetical protein